MVGRISRRETTMSTIARLLKMLLKTPVAEKPLEPEILPPAVVNAEARPQA
ncbi:MAG: acetyl-CoA carboxylase carboxyl transferase subunit beta, partial [Mesorhizobium sp.]